MVVRFAVSTAQHRQSQQCRIVGTASMYRFAQGVVPAVHCVRAVLSSLFTDLPYQIDFHYLERVLIWSGQSPFLGANVSTQVFALKGRSILAQGNALGTMHDIEIAALQSVDKFKVEVGCQPPGGNVGDTYRHPDSGGWDGKTKEESPVREHW